MQSSRVTALAAVFVFVGCFSPSDEDDEVGDGDTSSMGGTEETQGTTLSTDSSDGATTDSTGDSTETTDDMTTTDSSESSDTTTEDTGPVDTEPPTLEFGSFIDSTHISLTFSEPIESVAGVNPAKFRPSESWWDSDDSGMVYLDLLNDFPDDNCPCITGFGLENDPDDSYTIVVELSAPTTAVTCMNADYNYLPVMHYDADTLGTAEHIRDLSGNVLAEFGGVFVASPGESSMVLPADLPFPDFPLGGVLLDYSVICP